MEDDLKKMEEDFKQIDDDLKQIKWKTPLKK
jgi:hypothetical protein